VDTAALHLEATPFSIYATLPAAEIAHLLDNADCGVVVTEAAHADRVAEAAGRLGHGVEVITVDEAPAGAPRTLADLEAAGDADLDFEATWRAVGPDDVLTLIYTSGTTGPPKGVEITHANMLHQVAMVGERLPIEAGDTITSFLPSAHIADRWSCHYNNLVLGVQVTTVADGRTVAEVLPGVRPTLWGGVPRVAERLVAGIEAAIAGDADEQRRARTRRALEVGQLLVDARQAGQAPDPALAAEHRDLEDGVLAPLRQRIGLDLAKWIIIGAAPLSRRVQRFLLGLGLPLVELYGMSEASCVVSVSPPDDVHIGYVGELLDGLDLRVADDGELLIKGPTVMRGYRHEPDKTAEVLEDGWLRTGDVVEVGDHGQLRIVDRKKELLINAAGKNMSPANIELQLTAASSLISQAVVIGNGRRFNVALIAVDRELAARHAGLDPSMPLEAVTKDPAVAAAVDEAVARANAELSRVEQVRAHHLLTDEWEPGGDVLTPTMKVRRRVVDQRYATEIDALYEEAT
jgi:long-subunit acyl-CoA synthetase (AMP-forming)